VKIKIAFVGIVGLIAGLFIGAQAPRSDPAGTYQFAFGRLHGMRLATNEPIPMMLDTRSGQLYYFEPSTDGRLRGQWMVVEATEPRKGNDRGITYTPAPNR
jgi:hypothetical protein